MPIKVIWDNEEKTIVRHIFEGQWTWDEFEICTQESKALMESVDYTVQMILDVQKSPGMPQGFLSHMRTVTQKPHPNAGALALVGASSFIRAFTNVFLNVTPSNKRSFMMCATVDEAREWLAKRIQA